MRRVSLVRAAWLVLLKDWRLEWRTRARATALVFFSGLTLLLFSFAIGPDTNTLRAHAAGYLWLALLFASVLSLGESFRVESENQALLGMLLAPVEARAIFLGKVFGNTSLLFGLSVVLLIPAVALFDIDITREPASLLTVLFLGSLGISSPGIVYSAISANARARDVLLPLLMFPALVPLLLATVHATRFSLLPDPQGQFSGWLQLLTAFDLIYLSVGFLLFPKVVEED